MDAELFHAHVALAEDHVSLGESHISKQRALVAKLVAEGCDVTRARQLLEEFEESKMLHVANRYRLRRELGLEG